MIQRIRCNKLVGHCYNLHKLEKPGNRMVIPWGVCPNGHFHFQQKKNTTFYYKKLLLLSKKVRNFVFKDVNARKKKQ